MEGGGFSPGCGTFKADAHTSRQPPRPPQVDQSSRRLFIMGAAALRVGGASRLRGWMSEKPPNEPELVLGWKQRAATSVTTQRDTLTHTHWGQQVCVALKAPPPSVSGFPLFFPSPHSPSPLSRSYLFLRASSLSDLFLFLDQI